MNKEKQKMSGSFWLDGFEFRYSIVQQKSGPYAGRGQLNLISPEDGKILQMVGAEKRKRLESASAEEREKIRAGKRSEVLNASAALYIRNFDKDEATKAIERIAQKLLHESTVILDQIMKKIAPTHKISVLSVVQQNKSAFISQYYRNKSDKTKSKQRRTLEKAAEVLGSIPLR